MAETGGKPTVYFSNQLERLAESLGEALFQKGKDPFKGSVVFLPHHSLKSYLNFFFASHPKWSISAGIEYKTLLEGIMDLLDERVLSKTALSFMLERALHEKEDFSLEEKKLWIAEELSSIFSEYHFFEPRALQSWLEESGWKQDLYKQLFSSRSIEALLQEKEEKRSFHLFGFSYLQPHFCDFFTKSSSTFYFLSPTEMFWEDLCSNRERIYLEKKMVGAKMQLQVQEQMSFFLKKTHPILANFGKAGRSLLTQFGEEECYLEERYHPPEGDSTLSFIQESLFQLEDEGEKKALKKEDSSFLCVSATSKLREVEVLQETLQELVQKFSIQPKDILVLTSDLDAYFPYIQAVFSQKSSPFAFSVHGLSPLCSKEESKDLFSFFTLIEGRFELEPFLAFLSKVSSKWDFHEKDLQLFKQVLEKVHVLWGLSKEHKESALSAAWPENAFALPTPLGGTLLEGLEKVMFSLAYGEGDPLLQCTEVETFGRLIQIVEILNQELRPIYQKEKKTFEQWVVFVKNLLLQFFEASRERESFLSNLETLQKELREESFPLSFSGFKRAFDPYFQGKKESVQSHQLNAVKFLSLEMDGAYPADLIYVLGCDEDSIPQREVVSSLNEMHKLKKTPSSSDQSRYLFLELLLHARKSLVFSYERVSEKDGKARGPSRLMEEILNYIDSRVFFEGDEKLPSEAFTRDHPAMSFSKSYFEKSALFPSYSSKTFALAKSYYQKEKKNLPSFLIAREKGALSHTVDIRKIEEFAKSPTRVYFKETLGIFFPFSPPKDKEFFFSAPIKAGVKKRALLDSLEQGASVSRAKGELPLGELGKIGEGDLHRELLEWKEGLSFFGLEEKDLLLVEFVEGARKVEIIQGKVISPPLVLPVEGIGDVKVIGHLYPISSEGLVFFAKRKKGDFSLFWPSWLIYLCIAKKLGFSSSLLLIHEKMNLTDAPEDPEKWLAKYLKLYFKSLKEPCQVRADWVSSLVLKEELAKKIAPSSYDIGYKDPYEEWAEGRDLLPLAEEIKKEWEEPWREAFAFFIKEEGAHVEV